MVAVTALIVATGEGAEWISPVGSGFGEHEVLAEHVGGNKSVGIGAGKYHAAGDHYIVKHLPRVAIGVGADAVVEHFPHRVV